MLLRVLAFVKTSSLAIASPPIFHFILLGHVNDKIFDYGVVASRPLSASPQPSWAQVDRVRSRTLQKAAGDSNFHGAYSHRAKRQVRRSRSSDRIYRAWLVFRMYSRRFKQKFVRQVKAARSSAALTQVASRHEIICQSMIGETNEHCSTSSCITLVHGPFPIARP